jgi:hypothetical protein
MKSTMAVLVTIGVLASGCGTYVSFTPLNSAAAGPTRSANEVDVYLTAPPQRRHRDVGLLEAEQESDLSLDDTRDMLKKLRERAGAHGCDAIFVKGVGSNTHATLGISDHASSTKTITATCICYTD